MNRGWVRRWVVAGASLFSNPSAITVCATLALTATLTSLRAVEAKAASRCLSVATLRTIERDLARANVDIRHKAFGKANDELRSGLRLMGSAYYSPDLIDDTGQHLSLADYYDYHRRPDRAANVRFDILKERLEIYRSSNPGGHC